MRADSYFSGIITHKYAPVNTVYSENLVFLSPTSRKIGATGAYYTLKMNTRGIQRQKSACGAVLRNRRKSVILQPVSGDAGAFICLSVVNYSIQQAVFQYEFFDF